MTLYWQEQHQHYECLVLSMFPTCLLECMCDCDSEALHLPVTIWPLAETITTVLPLWDA